MTPWTHKAFALSLTLGIIALIAWGMFNAAGYVIMWVGGEM